MKVIEKFRKISALNKVKQVPHGHLAAATVLSVCLGVVSMLPSKDASATRQVQSITLPSKTSLPSRQEDFTQEIEQALIDTPNLMKNTITVKAGDNLSKIFARAGLNDKQMMELVNGSKQAKKLAQLYPGHRLEFATTSDKQLYALNYTQNKLNSFSFKRVDEKFEYSESVRKPDVKKTLRSATIDSSLFAAGRKSNLDDKLVMELAGIFGWDIDFALDIRKGDSFKILYEEAFLDGEKISNGNILAAEFINQGREYRAVRYVNTSGETNYFTPEGNSMRKAFLMAPLDFRRISSNFNPRRLHPISKKVKPHRGTDYAAARGTPVWSSGNGRVIASSYTKANGKYVVIQHGNNIQTKYLHLHKRFVKHGQRVKQGQRIGSVGSTGYSTAPHLHYEFLIDGVHRNPRTIVKKLPKAKSVNQSELALFKTQTQPLLAELAPTTASTKLAFANKNNLNNSL